MRAPLEFTPPISVHFWMVGGSSHTHPWPATVGEACLRRMPPCTAEAAAQYSYRSSKDAAKGPIVLCMRASLDRQGSRVVRNSMRLCSPSVAAFFCSLPSSDPNYHAAVHILGSLGGILSPGSGVICHISYSVAVRVRMKLVRRTTVVGHFAPISCVVSCDVSSVIGLRLN